MPLYEYECQSCGTKIEALQRFDDPPPESCECGEKGQLKKLFSAPAFQFKGDGWYVTDYARKEKDGQKAKDGQKTKDGQEAKGDSGGSETKSSESKSSETKSSPAKSAPASTS